MKTSNKVKNLGRISALLIIILLAACGPSQEEIATQTAIAQTAIAAAWTDTPPPTATQTPMPTDTPTPLPTATATATKKPTKTFTPTVAAPDILNQFLEGVQVKDLDTFETYANWYTTPADKVYIRDGQLTINGTTFWASGSGYDKNFKENEGVYFQYKYSPNPEFEMYFDTGEWQNENYRRFGIYGFGGAGANLWQGPNTIGWGYLNGNLPLRPDTWYSVFMAIGENAEFLAVIWDPQDPTRYLLYNEIINEKWIGKSWIFRLGANRGLIEFDDFARFTFESIK